MKWRVIMLEKHSAYENMSIDEAISNGVAEGTSKPTIRFYGWSPSAVSIGYFQSMDEEVNIERCKELGIDYVRRLTGGGAVYHDTEGELTYSIIAPESLFPKGIHESYREICGCVIKGLSGVGINASFAPINDIVVDGKKISGNAQTRRGGVLLQHGTILYKLDVKKMFEVLKVSKEKISDKMIKNVEDRVTCVSDFSDVSMNDLCEFMLRGFVDGKDYEFENLNAEELDKVNELGDTYKSTEWNFRR